MKEKKQTKKNMLTRRIKYVAEGPLKATFDNLTVSKAFDYLSMHTYEEFPFSIAKVI